MPEDDLAFTFDTSFFDKGIDKVMKGFSSMEDKAHIVAKGVSKGLTNVAVNLGVVVAGFKSIKTALFDMPEVGQAFGIAKDVFLKNLLFPLRKEILPLLQDMLDWVRDSRVRFVKWGNNLANIFRVVVSGVKSIISFIKRMSEQASIFAERVFGERTRSIEDIFNLVTFKLSTVIEFAGILAEDVGNMFSNVIKNLNGIGTPLGEIINNLSALFGDLLKFTVAVTDSFLLGFVPAIKDAMTPIKGISESLLSIFDSIFGSTESIKTWKGVFEGIGTVVGNTLVASFEFIDGVLNKINKTLARMKEGKLTEDLKREADISANFLTDFVKDLFGPIVYDLEEYNRKGGLFGSKKKKVDDAIITPDGKVIETNPKDTLVAIKDRKTSLKGLMQDAPRFEDSRPIDIKIDFTGMQIVLQEGGVQEGQEVATGIVEEIRDALNAEMEKFGL